MDPSGQKEAQDQGHTTIGKAIWEEALLPTKKQSKEWDSVTLESQDWVRRLGDGGGESKRTTCSRTWGLGPVQNFLSEGHKTDVMRSLRS